LTPAAQVEAEVEELQPPVDTGNVIASMLLPQQQEEPTFDTALSMLQDIALLKNSSRTAIDGQDAFVGVRWKYQETPQELRPTITHLNQLLKIHHPNFVFTSVCLNKNTVSSGHVDGSNLLGTDSMILGLGNYTGGSFKVRIDMRDDTWQTFDIRNTFVRFSGHDYHASTPFEGERFSIVWFTHRLWNHFKNNTAVTEHLLQMSFNLPQDLN
jgi:hypothetical protein